MSKMYRYMWIAFGDDGVRKAWICQVDLAAMHGRKMTDDEKDREQLLAHKTFAREVGRSYYVHFSEGDAPADGVTHFPDGEVEIIGD